MQSTAETMMTSSCLLGVALVITCSKGEFATPPSTSPLSGRGPTHSDKTHEMNSVPVNNSLADQWLAEAHDQARPLYKDPSQTVDVRTQDLLARMTLDEKVAQLT